MQGHVVALMIDRAVGENFSVLPMRWWWKAKALRYTRASANSLIGVGQPGAAPAAGHGRVVGAAVACDCNANTCCTIRWLHGGGDDNRLRRPFRGARRSPRRHWLKVAYKSLADGSQD